MKSVISAVIITVFFSVAGIGIENGEEILRKSDAKVFPANASYELTIEVENDNGRVSRQHLVGYKSGSSRNVVIVREPKKNEGTVEMRRDNSIWVYFNTNGKTMKSAFHSLAIGEDVCYGDILSGDLSYDYFVESSANVNKDIVLTLKPRPGHECYAKLIVVVDGSSFVPKRREYYAVSGTLLKKCEIDSVEYGPGGSVVRYRQKFFDPLKNKKSLVTVDRIRSMNAGEIPDRYFNETQMKFIGVK